MASRYVDKDDDDKKRGKKKSAPTLKDKNLLACKQNRLIKNKPGVL